MRYCPNCAQPLIAEDHGGRERLACPDRACGFVHFGNFSIGCGGVVLREGKTLLVQRGWEPARGAWQLPGGYAEHDESLLEAVEREVLEESGVVARARDVIAFRHSIGAALTPAGTSGRSTNIYVVFRLDYIEGEPAGDGDETMHADFYSRREIEEMDAIQGLSRWAIYRAWDTPLDGGFEIDRDTTILPDRPGWQAFAARWDAMPAGENRNDRGSDNSTPTR